MANSKQAKKRIGLNEKRRQRNASNLSRMRTAIKKVKKALENNAVDDAREAFKHAASVIDRMVTKGVIHINAAARYKSRLHAKIKAQDTAAA